MYYEEIIVNGVLCSRSTPDGEFVRKTPQELTHRIVGLIDALNDCARHPRKAQRDNIAAKAAPK